MNNVQLININGVLYAVPVLYQPIIIQPMPQPMYYYMPLDSASDNVSSVTTENEVIDLTSDSETDDQCDQFGGGKRSQSPKISSKRVCLSLNDDSDECMNEAPLETSSSSGSDSNDSLSIDDGEHTPTVDTENGFMDTSIEPGNSAELVEQSNDISHDEEPRITWHVKKRYERFCNHFKKNTKVLEIRMEHNLANVNLLVVDSMVEEFFQKFLNDFANDAHDNDRITISFAHNDLTRDIFINFEKRNYKDKSIFDAFNKVVQSNMKVLLDGIMNVKLSIIKNITGSANGRRSRAPRTPQARTVSSKSTVEITNRDNSCGYLAIALGKFHADMNSRNEEHRKHYKNLCHQNNNKLRNLAHALCVKVGIDMQTPMDLGEILPKIQEILTDYQIIVIDDSSKSCLYQGPVAEKVIALQYIRNHFNLITKIAGFMQSEKFCIECWKKTTRRHPHICPSGCSMCLNKSKCRGEQNVICVNCNRSFYSNSCLQRHISNNVCQTIKYCTECHIQYSSNHHECDRFHCKKCNSYYFKSPHYCMMTKLQKEKLQKEDENLKYIVAFDIEAVQDVEIHGDDPQATTFYIHHPILLIAKVACNKCENNAGCNQCGNRVKKFYGFNCVSKFNDFILTELALEAQRKKARIYVFAHNNKGYDGHFVIRDLFTREIGDEQIIMQGSTILKLDVGNVRFIDSLCFFHQALDKLPKSFGIANTMKGYFPHAFNTRQNQSYVGRIPPLSAFSPELMKPEQKLKFEQWYSTQQELEYNLKNEMYKYCENDVDILLQSIMKFRKLFKSETGLDPITRCFTLASVGLEYFRSSILTENTMAITPTTPYGKLRMSSRKANIWLDWVEKVYGNIDREQRIGPYFCDGRQEQTVYEFWGCYWHGCDQCYDDRETMIRVGDSEKSRAELFRKVQEKIDYYAERNFNLIQIWEHDYNELQKESRFKLFEKSRHEFYNRFGDCESLDIRDAFFGGRTNNLYFSYECKDDEEIAYVDFTSLYPFVLSKFKYPVGHPKVIRDNFKEVHEYFGFVKCKVLAPSNLYVPILPVRIDNKLMFPLCGKCGELKQQTPCEHNFEERCITGTWTTEEIMLALQFDYEIVETYEVLNYDDDSQSETLYKAYIEKWLRIKTQASGWPEWCQSQDDKLKFISDFYAKENVVLDHESIEKNEGLRFIAKLLLNSLWGKFAQRCNLKKTEIIRDRAKYWKILSDETIDVTGEFTPAQGITVLEYEKRFLEDCEPGQTNIAVASFVTAYARKELYSLISKLERNRSGSVLYFDTDSVIFVRKITDTPIPTGDYLGELTNEIAKEYGSEARCTGFVSCGPKNYGLQIKLNDGSLKTTLKVKGLTLNSQSLDVVNFQEMVRIAKHYTEGNQESIQVPQWNIFSNKTDHVVKTKIFKKIYRACSEKRRIHQSYTLPYGYQ